MLRVLLLGQSGQLASELRAATPTSIQLKVLGYAEFWSLSEAELHKIFFSWSPDWVINATAYNQVDQAELFAELAMAGNFYLVQKLQRLCVLTQSRLLHISTDYVFDGKSLTDYRETDPVNPQNAYGRTKLAGELGVVESGADAYIVRTSWVFGEFGNNFVYTMQRLAQTHPKLSVVNDQLGRPTWTRTLAEFMLHLITVNATFGTYHLSNDDTATWFDFAREILKTTAVEVAPVTSAEFPQKAYRPKHSVMSLDKAKATGFDILNWREALAQFLASLQDKD